MIRRYCSGALLSSMQFSLPKMSILPMKMLHTKIQSRIGRPKRFSVRRASYSSARSSARMPKGRVMSHR